MDRILLHGLGQTPDAWRRMVAALPDCDGIRCPDLFRGLEDPVYPRLYETLVQTLEETPEPVHLCGLSLGAVLALDYALCHPERVASLLLIAPQYRIPVRLLRFQSVVFRLMPERAFRGAGLGKRDMLRLTGSMLSLNLSGALEKLACPVLVVCGERDRANRRVARELADRLSAELQWIRDAGHEVNVEAPEVLAHLAAEFWNRHSVP